MAMNRKPSGKRGKEQYYDRRRKEDEWNKGPPSYVSKPKKKYGGRYDSRDYDYQYIHKDRKQYGRDELLKLAGRAAIKTDVLEQLSLKYDLVFGEELRKPIGDIDESKEDRFVESTNDGENPKGDRRDEYDYNDRDKDRYDRYRDRDRDRGRGDRDRADRGRDREPSDKEERGYQRKKEFVRFDALNDSNDYDKMDSYLEKKCKTRDDDDDLPAWATEDYEGEVPAWGKIETTDILKQTENSDKWASMNMKTLNKQEVKNMMDDQGSNQSGSDDGRDHYENEEDYYTYDKKTHKYKFFEEYEEDDEQGKEDDKTKRKASKTSQDSGNTGFNNLDDITSLWKKMKKEEEEEQNNKEDDYYYGEEVLNANFYEEELMEKRRELGMNEKTGGPPVQRAYEQPPRTNASKPSLVDDLFGGLNSQVVHRQDLFKPTTSQPQFQLNNLNSILGAFALDEDSQIEPNSSSKRLNNSEDQSSTQQAPDDIDLIVGPPPSVVKQAEPEVDEKKEKSKKDFQEKYFAMDKALNQIVYDALNSRRRNAIDANSTNGVNQISVEKYCANNYKIFSFLMQGDVFSKVWHYKDKVGNCQGPYMSFDMDIWNGEGVYFSKNLAISPNKKDYFPLAMFLERDNAVLEVVQDVVEKLEKGIDQHAQNPMYMKMMYSPPYPGWVPPQLMQGQIPLMPFPKNSNGPPHGQAHGNRKRGADGFSKRGGHNNYQSHHNTGHYKRIDSGYSPVNPPQEAEQQSDMTHNLKDMLGLPNDPAIQMFSSRTPQTENRPGPANQTSTPGTKSQEKNLDDDFPSLSATLKK
jgi:hypothetical protein